MLEELWREFEREVPPLAHVDLDEAQELAEIRQIVDAGLAFVAEEDGRTLGFALARRPAPASVGSPISTSSVRLAAVGSQRPSSTRSWTR